MKFKHPVMLYTAATNVEAHVVVEMLHANGIPAYAVEDQSGVSLWMFGTISQFHQPNVWVDKSTAEKAIALVRQFEENKRKREHPDTSIGTIPVACEECGKTTMFPDALNGTTQDCSHCNAYVDVGELPWNEDFGMPDE
jgi:putative signal transducing protein